MDSEFLHSGFQVLDSGFLVSGTWTPDTNLLRDSGFLELNYGFQSPGFQIPRVTFSRIPESDYLAWDDNWHSMAPWKEIRIPECEKIFLVENLEFWALESGIQLKESGHSLTIEIQNPSFSDKDRYTVPGIRNPLRGIQNPKLSWIPIGRIV